MPTLIQIGLTYLPKSCGAMPSGSDSPVSCKLSINERKLTESGRTPVFSRKKLNSFPIPHYVQEEFFFMSTATIAFIEA